MTQFNDEELCLFAVKLGNIEGRFDVKNVLFTITHHKANARSVTLGELCIEEPCYGTSASAIKRENDTIPKYIRITDFDNLGIEEDHEYMAAESYSSKHLLQPNDILFARTGATVGKTYFYDGKIGKAVFAGYCIRFRLDTSKVLPKFVYWYTKTDIYRKWVHGVQRPSGQPNINKEEYKSLEILLPDMETQCKIVDYIENKFIKYQVSLVDTANLIDLSKTSSYLLNLLGLESIKYDKRMCCVIKLSRLVGDRTFSAEYYHPERMSAIHSLTSNPTMPVVKLSDIVSFHRDIVCSTKSSDYLGLAGVESNTGELSGVQEEASGQAYVYQQGDILYGRLRPYLNKVLLAEKDGICSTEFHIMRVIDAETVLPEYIAAILRSDLILSQTKHMMTGNTHPRISNDDVKNLYIPIPSLSLQKTICDELQKRRIEARKLKAEAEQEWQDAKAQFEKELLGE